LKAAALSRDGSNLVYAGSSGSPQTTDNNIIYQTPSYPDPDEAGTIGDAISPTSTSSTRAAPLFRWVNSDPLLLTREGTSPLVYHCWYTELPGGCASVTGQFITLSTPVTGADTYVEIGFTSGTLAANGRTGRIYINVTKQDWSDFDQGNDYSFRSSGSLYRLEQDHPVSK
jgi:hypothetical protein